MKVLALALAVVPMVATFPADARADVRVGIGVAFRGSDERGYGYRDTRYRDTARYGYDRGFREGTRDGYKDGHKGRRFDVDRDGDYRDADNGYKGWMGPRWEFARGFRRGYEGGYRQGYQDGWRERHGRDFRDDDRWRYQREYDRDDR
jgi:hypothetical protein